MFVYFEAKKTAGYSGFVMYNCYGAVNFWMVPETFFDDWDNQ